MEKQKKKIIQHGRKKGRKLSNMGERKIKYATWGKRKKMYIKRRKHQKKKKNCIN